MRAEVGRTVAVGADRRGACAMLQRSATQQSKAGGGAGMSCRSTTQLRCAEAHRRIAPPAVARAKLLAWAWRGLAWAGALIRYCACHWSCSARASKRALGRGARLRGGASGCGARKGVHAHAPGRFAAGEATGVGRGRRQPDLGLGLAHATDEWRLGLGCLRGPCRVCLFVCAHAVQCSAVPPPLGSLGLAGLAVLSFLPLVHLVALVCSLVCMVRFVFIHACIHTYKHTCMHACMHVRMHACMCVCVRVCVRACVRVCVVRVRVRVRVRVFAWFGPFIFAA
jgi:hypothetical protein